MAAENKKKKSIPIEVTYTEGYEQRFTEAILRIYEGRLRSGKLDELIKDFK